MLKSRYITFIFVNIIFLLSILSLVGVSTTTSNLTVTIQQNLINDPKTSQNFLSTDSNQSVSSTNSNQAVAMTTAQVRQAIGLQWLVNQGYNGTGIIIGSVDTGVNAGLYPAEFGNKLIATQSFVNTANNYASNDTTVTDNNGHGTETASLMVGNNFGMANGSDLVAAKIYSDGIAGNAGYQGEETTRGVYYGVLYCVEHNASIINLSLGQYSNIVNDGRQYIIDKMAKEHDVIFTISAGNDGYSGIDGSTIGTPGTAFQAITVAASSGTSSMAYFSSSGIRIDYTVKPDVTAPGVNIASVTGLISGTSAAAPIVGGGTAVLIQALRAHGRSYTPGAIKAALIKTANPIGNNPVWYQGAGMVNFTAAYFYLMNASVTTNHIPIVATAFPTKLPIIPLNSLFIDQTTPFNLTVLSSVYDGATISLHGIPTDTMSFNNFQYFNASDRLSLLFHPTSSTLPGNYTGYLLLNFTLGPVVYVSISFTVKIPFIKVLFDETKNGFINDKKPHQSYLPLNDAWGYSTFLLGQYREFYALMANNNISVTPFYSGTYTNLTYLQNYDVIIFSYPNSFVNNTFTDWYNDPLFGNLFKLTEPTLLFSPAELTTLNTFVKEYSKGILILTGDQRFTNTTAFDSLLNSFNVGYKLTKGAIYDKEPLPITDSNYIFSSVSNVDYYGTSFTSLNTNPNTVSLENNKFLLLNDLSRNLPNRGRIAVSGSAYFAENYMLNPDSNPTNYQNDCKLVLNLLYWLNGGNTPQTEYLTKTVTTTKTQSCNITQTVANSSTSKTNENTSFAFMSSFIVIPLIAIVKRHKKKI